MEQPKWLDTDKRTKKALEQTLKEHHMKTSFRKKQDTVDFYNQLTWAWNMPWREDQAKVISSFFDKKYSEVVIQAIFGGGKTTMMLAIIHMLVLHDPTLVPNIFICAFNIGIKNEIKKKLHNLGKFNVSTFDSVIWHCCDELKYEDLKLLNFEAKRRFVRENLDQLTTKDNFQYVFIDESQDLEKQCYPILKKLFPKAKFMFVGDVFQSIQKEPRESMMWYLLNRVSTRSTAIYKMMDTPRVPIPILDEIKEALLQYYPEFASTIHQWKSSSTFSTPTRVTWIPFQNYQAVNTAIMKKLQVLDHKDTMILTFSSAITVRGSLGDIARFRRFLQLQGIDINPNHKRMLDDRLFLTTANSSKGLERKHVLCILTFPLELAFSNFSNDLVMNLITVALSRCKESITFFVPNYMDRFSKVLNCFSNCPKPAEKPVIAAVDPAKLPQTTDTKKKPKKQKRVSNTTKECQSFEYDPKDKLGMLQMEHSVTEILRQGILRFETRQLLLRYARQDQVWNLASASAETIRTEEECALSGLIFESLILSLWTGRFPTSDFASIQHHSVFSHHIENIRKKDKHYQQYIKKHPKISSETIRFEGSFLYAQLHLYAYQKIWVKTDSKKNAILYKHWQSILPTIRSIVVPNAYAIKTQVNISMPLLKGIMDAARVPKSDASDSMDIFEIKASRASDWKQNTMLQAILYGIMNGKAFFNTYLINVFSKQAKLYKVYLKKDLMWLRAQITQDMINWNLNCYLAKNIVHSQKTPNVGQVAIPVHETLFVDGFYDVLQQKYTEFTICEFTSITKTKLTTLVEKVATNLESQTEAVPLLQQLQEAIEKYRKIYDIKTVYGGFFLGQHFDLPSLEITPLFAKETIWSDFVEANLGTDQDKIKLDFTSSAHCLAIQITSLVTSTKYLLLE
jgi:AAA domain